MGILIEFFLLALASLGASAQNSSSRCDVCTPLKVYGVPVHSHCFNSIYAFGDSLEDTGNFVLFAPPPPPYGITNPGCPKGRLSDGALTVDFIAHAYGLPTLAPYLACPCGTNFAIAGATVLSTEFYLEQGIVFFLVSFDNETQWFQEYRSECSSRFSKSLFVVGGGGNDYTAQFLAGRTPTEVLETVDLVVGKIVRLVEELSRISKAVLVLNIPQTSCTPLYKETFQDPEGVNKFGCLISYGRVVEEHNLRLQQALFQWNSSRNIAIGDRFAFLYSVLQSPLRYGFLSTDVACCGGGGPYRARVQCGTPNSTVCQDPNKFVYFDQVHFTENFNRQQVRAFFSDNKYIITKNPHVFCL